jgi:hypothetical protein
MNSKLWSILVAATIVLAMAPSSAGAVQDEATEATEEITFSLNPVGQPDGSFFEFEAAPGSTTSLSVEFTNHYSEPLALRSYVADGYTLPNGGLGVALEGQSSQLPTPWISYPAETHELAPDETRQVDFEVTVPAEAAPGNYVSVLVLQTAEAVPVAGTELFDQILQKALAIDITVPGDVSPEFTLGAPAYDDSGSVPALIIPLENTGNVRLRPSGTLTLSDNAGNPVLNSDIALGSVFARTSTTIELVLQQPLASGSYVLNLTLSDPDTDASASLVDVPLSVVTATPEAPSLVSLEGVQITPLPDAAAPQFASITGTIANGDQPIASGRLTLVAFLDGEEVERFTIIPSLSLPQGETAFEQRYIPITGFTSGTWTFQLVLESVDPASGTGAVITTLEVETPIVVP